MKWQAKVFITILIVLIIIITYLIFDSWRLESNITDIKGRF